ncbi:MAG: hypothetical protein GY765_08365, partial [bacterium]|nr:hypothetical protein [bacterium]
KGITSAGPPAPTDARPVTNGNFSKLKQIIEDNGTFAEIVEGFPLEELTSTDNFISLLFYFGLLTIKTVARDQPRLTIPNETARRLYFDYIKEAYRETGVFSLDLTTYSNLMTEMAYDGKWRPLFDFLTGRMRESMSLRDLITGEKSIQAFLNVYLGLSNLYVIHPEKELNKGYADLVMEPFLARYEGIAYSYLIELKYIKPGAAPVPRDKEKIEPGIAKIIEQAEAQLKKYSMDGKFKKNIGKTTLIKLVLIFSGHDLVYMDKVET